MNNTTETNTEKQVKSKERVQKHGEVFTPQWVVNDMLNLLPDEVWTPEKTFLEPACGEGAFLIEIYKRKLQNINSQNQNHWEWYAAIVTSSIYGIELLEDNVKQCRKNLLKIFNDFYTKKFPNSIDNQLVETVKFLIDCNIIQGNALTCRKCSLNCGNECDKCDLIIFSEWKIANDKGACLLVETSDYKFQRNDYIYKELIKAEEMQKKASTGFFEVEFSNEKYGLKRSYNPVNYKEIQYAKD